MMLLCPLFLDCIGRGYYACIVYAFPTQNTDEIKNIGDK